MVTDIQFKTAVLIDGENIAAKHYPSLEKSIHQIRQAAVFRVFGDFSNPSHAAWLSVCKDHAVEPILHLPVGTSKNGTDMAITIAAMDIMASRQFAAVFIASDDCDFLPLVRRLRNEGILVHGIGLKSATAAAQSLYNSWTVLPSVPTPQPTSVALQLMTGNTAVSLAKKVSIVKVAVPAKAVQSTKLAPKTTIPPPNPLAAEFSEITRAKLSEGDMTLSTLGSWIGKQQPHMKPLLGPGKLKKLLIADGHFKIDGVAVSLINQQKK